MADKQPRTFSGRAARQGEIILRTPLRRAIFVAGLAGAVIIALLLGLFLR
jgi:hypothetical protein